MERVPDPVDGDEPSGVLRIGLDFGSEILHMGVDGAASDPAISAVEAIEQARAAEDDAGMQGEFFEQVELGAGEVQKSI